MSLVMPASDFHPQFIVANIFRSKTVERDCHFPLNTRLTAMLDAFRRCVELSRTKQFA